MSSKLSPPAKQALKYFKQNPDKRINYRTLMENGVSRRKSLAILKELREAKYIEIVKLVGGGTNVKVVTSDVTTVVTSGIAIDAVTLVSSNSVSYTAVTSNKATNKFFDEVEEESESMGYDFFDSGSSGDDELAREREKHTAQKKVEYVAAKAKAAEIRGLHRSKIDPANWTCKDVAYEFSDNVANLWNIKPFSVIQSRFVPALSAFRKQHDTNGALELELISMFFSTLKAEKYTDGNHLWRAFLYQAPGMLQSARERVLSSEDVQTAIVADQEVSAKKRALLEDDDV